MSGRKWTTEEIDRLRADYGRVPVAALAADLGRSAPSVAQKAQLLGFGRRNRARIRWTPAVEARYRARHAEGLTDAEIAAEFGCLRQTLNGHRRRLGLPTNRGSARARVRNREQLLRQLAAVGAPSFAALRHERSRRFAAGYGLPEGLPPRAVQIALVLLTGPKTKSQICAALGLTWHPGKRAQKCLNAGGGRSHYLSVLGRHGLVARHRIPGTGGKGPSVCGREQNLYALTPFALTLLSRKDASA